MRYIDRRVIRNSTETYEATLEDKGVLVINHYDTPKLRHLSASQVGRLERLTHVWKVGDRYYKLAHEHYGNSKYWWVIAWYNKKPTESHVTLGDLVFIPLPLEKVLRFLGM